MDSGKANDTLARTLQPALNGTYIQSAYFNGTQPPVDYTGNQEIRAWYLMGDLPVLSWLHANGGVRVEGRAARVGELLNVPPGRQVRIVLPVGVPVEPGTQRERFPFSDRAWFNRYDGVR